MSFNLPKSTPRPVKRLVGVLLLLVFPIAAVPLLVWEYRNDLIDEFIGLINFVKKPW